MGKLQSKKQINKVVKKNVQNQGCSSKQSPWFSFQDLTTNSKYNLNNLTSVRDRETVFTSLFNRLRELSSKLWLYWMQQPKNVGLETLSYDHLNFKTNADSSLSADSTVYVFRFNTHNGPNKGRIIGYKNPPCSVLHIIGFDLDFSAYSHG